MATSKISLDEGTTTHTATNTISEDAVTKHIPRSVLNTSAGTETGVAANPLQVSLANTGANATAIKVDNSAVTQPVSGTVTANLGTIADVATQTTLNSLNGKVTACNTGAVTISAALPAGTNAIGKLAANSGVDIGDVDVLSLPALAAGTNIIGAVKRDVVNYTPVRKYFTGTGAQTDGIVWSPASGKKWAITDISFSTSAAATVTFEDDKAGGDAVVMAWDLAANGGVTMNFQTPLLSEEADADLIVTTSAGNIKCVVSGYEF